MDIYIHGMTGGGRRDRGLTKKDDEITGAGQPMQRRSRIAAAIFVGVLCGCVFAFVYPTQFFTASTPARYAQIVAHSDLEVPNTSCVSPERLSMLKSEYIAASAQNAELKEQIRLLTDKLRLAQQTTTDSTQNQFLVLREQKKKAGPFGTVKGSGTNPSVVPDESVNPRLAKMLDKLAIDRELIVALANSHVRDTLEVWFTNIKKVGIRNYLVYALDDGIASFCESNNVPFYKRGSKEGKTDEDNNFDSIAKGGSNHAISGLKFQVLRTFLQLGYSVLLSDIDTVYIQNPFNHLYRDSDIESMSDGHDNQTAYGYNDAFDEPELGSTVRIWVYNSGFFYIRPTIPSIELLDRVASRLSQEKAGAWDWDQAVLNEELWFPSHPGNEGLHASRRTMDYLLFMNSKVLFKTVREDGNLKNRTKPVVVHIINSHPDKIMRMKAVVEYYVNGKGDALDPFPDGSEW